MAQYCLPMQETNAHVPEPELELRDGMPVSTAFDDVYFSRAGGVAETTHVFLKGNGLPGRWVGCSHFTIGELGFGTGLNFLVTLKAWRATADAGAILHYHSVEKYPFTREALRALLAVQPELAAEVAELLAVYPLRLPGVHRVHLGNVVLNLWFGDVAQWLDGDADQPRVDAWFLDGFSPAKNQAMWTSEILTRVAQRSAPGATCATFTAAGAVRRGLQAAGFAIEKTAGFGHKRDMLTGETGGASAAVGARRVCGPVIVIGAGIAGSTLAHALTTRGAAVTLVERGAVASGASGNAAGVLFPQLTKRWNPSTAWYFTAYGFMLRQLRYWQAQGLAFSHASPGMLRLPRHTEEEAQLRSLQDTLGLDPTIVRWMDRTQASAEAGLDLKTGGAFFPDGTWVSPPELCRALVCHPQIMLRENTAALSIAREGDAWAITLATGEVLVAPYLCVASAYDAQQLLPEYGLRLHTVGGQVSEYAASDVAAPLRSILCHKGYVIPRGDRYLIGATYHREDLLAVTPARHAENHAELETILPGWLRITPDRGRSSIRTTTPDRLPYVGALSAGLYLSIGHGSRGLLSAPLAAEMIASMVTGDALPVTQHVRQTVDPLRFTKA